MNRAIRWFVIFIVTTVVCVVGSTPVFVTGLFVQENVSIPLTLLTMGLLAALASSWASNLLSGETERSQLLRIVVVAETAAVLLSVFRLRISPGAVSLSVWGLFVSASACVAAFRFRDSGRNLKRDIVVSLVMLALMPAIVVAAIFVASLFGLTGA